MAKLGHQDEKQRLPEDEGKGCIVSLEAAISRKNRYFPIQSVQSIRAAKTM